MKTAPPRWMSPVLPALPVVLYLLFVFVFFVGPLTGHGTLSKAHLLGEWDSIYDEQRRGLSMSMDPSLVYLMLPSYLLKANMWHAGQIPLWNPYTGLGAPLLADPQSLTLSPLHLPLIFFPSLKTMSFVLALQVAMLGVSTYLLCRRLKLGVFAATYAMVVASMCPYHLYYMELLGNGFCMVPLVFLMIFNLRGRSFKERAWSAWTSAFGLTVCIFSAHVEMSFFAISIACLVRLVACALAKPASNDELGFKDLSVAIALTGAFTVLASAPLLVPFVEFVKNSECYKFGSGAPAIIPWQALLFNMLAPGYGGASPTLGALAVPLIVLSWLKVKDKLTSKNAQVIAALTVVSILALLVMSKSFGLVNLFNIPPMSFIVVTYALPATLLMLTLLSAFGLQRVLAPGNPESDKSLLLAGSLAAISGLVFWLVAQGIHLDLRQANFDLCVGNYAFNRHDMLRYSVASLAFVLALFVYKLKGGRTALITLLMVVSGSYLAELSLSRRATPTRPQFDYAHTDAIKTLIKTTGGGRSIATGNHLLRPNSNIVYGLRDLRSHNPLFPTRYLAFMADCGAEIDTFSQEFKSPLSPLLGLASVSGAATQDALAGTSWRLAGSPDHIDIHKNINSLPRAYITPAAKIVDSARAARSTIKAADFAPLEQIVIEGAQNNDGSSAAEPIAHEIRWELDGADKIAMAIDSERDGWLVLNDIYYPGWQATLDEIRTPVYRANYLMRAIKIPKGAHRVVFSYVPLSFALGVFCAALFLFAGIFFKLMSQKIKMRQGKPVS